jgi:Tfp pilus assembly protein PilO
MMRSKKELLDVACLIGLIALVALGSVAAVKLAVAKTKSAAREQRAVVVRLAEINKANAVLERLNAAIGVNEAALTRLRTRLPESQALGNFLTDLDGMMDRSGVDLSKITPGVPVAETLCKRTPLRFSCHGAFPDLHAVLYGLETQERVVRIDQVTLSKGDLPGKCKMEVSCSVYGR